LSAYGLPVDKSTARIAKRLARNVVSLRSKSGWSQEECADNLGIATAYLSRVERALINVTLRNLGKIAAGFDVDVSELLRPQ
jgi:transcriptional regulator with XRE-family HTH domain